MDFYILSRQRIDAPYVEIKQLFLRYGDKVGDGKDWPVAQGKDICNGLTGKSQEYCIALASSCDAQAKNPKILLDTLDGDEPMLFTDLDRCLAYSKFRASLDVPPGFKLLTGQTPHVGEGGGASTHTEGIVTADVIKGCRAAGPDGSDINDACRKMMPACFANKDGPFYLPLSKGPLKVDDRDRCISLALFYAKIQSKPTVGTAVIAGPEIQWKPDGRKKFAAAFADAGFAVDQGDSVHVQKLILPFHHDWTQKGIKIEIAYKIEKLGGDAYLLKYRIYDGDEDVPQVVPASVLDRSIRFSVSSGKINETLAFGVTLGSEGDFGDVKSIEIVRL